MILKEFKDKYLTKNVMVSIYFVFFIALNIFDFLGLLSQDLDFFKKILSWALICILFYQISLTKIFIGEKLKKYDFFYILGFLILIIPKTLKHYFNTVFLDQFIIFSTIIRYIELLLDSYLNFVPSFFLGILILLLTNFTLLSNHRVKEQSFVGSLHLQSTFGHRITTHITLTLLVFFFAFVIAPFFLEWFALSVDALILIIGLMYYLSIFIHKFREGGKVSNFLSLVSNTGSQFFKDLIQTFSHKKTFFIGVSFLLALHLLVDIGIYMIPYLLGTSSPLYFDSLEVGDEKTHVPIFNIFNFENSRIFAEVSAITSPENNSPALIKIIQFIFIICLYLSSYIFIMLLLLFPFYYIYKRINNELVHIPNKMIIFIISMSLFAILSQDIFMSTISMPILIGPTQVDSVVGVDIYTSSIFKEGQSLSSVDFSETISLLIFFILLFVLFVIIKFQKYKKIFSTITYCIFLLFFIAYTLTFYYASNNQVMENLLSEKTSSYERFIDLEKEITPELGYQKIKTITFESKIKIDGFAYNLGEETLFYGTYTMDEDTEKKIKENNNVAISTIDKKIIISLETIRYNDENIEDRILEKLIINNNTVQETFIQFILYIAFFFSTIFYVVGISIFSYHYIKTLLRRELN
ncbi:MAG: hypothetical protein VXZ40_03710 [Nanoarchaeota archaeon]|nr:hypothetical protein [Nanoarchaeota archaeon]